MKPMASSYLPILTSKPSIKSYSIPKIILISAASTIAILVCSLKMSKAFLFSPQTPMSQLNDLLVSNFRVSNSNVAAIWLANLTMHNPNIALAIRVNQIEASILYKHDNALSLTSVDDVNLGLGERKDVYVKFVTTGNERDQPIVEYPLLREIEKDRRQGKVSFRMRFNAMTSYEIDWLGWRTRPVITNPYNMDWDVNVRDYRSIRGSTASSNIGDFATDSSTLQMVTD